MDEKLINSLIERIANLEIDTETLRRDLEKYQTDTEGRFRYTRRRVTAIVNWMKKIAKKIKFQLPYILDQTEENKRAKNARVVINGEGE